LPLENLVAMFDATVYYCWACDAHRRIAAGADGKVHCPGCQRELTADSRLPIRGAALATSNDAALKIVWPAPIRPRLAASA
jgi:hypothetical protein